MITRREMIFGTFACCHASLGRHAFAEETKNEDNRFIACGELHPSEEEWIEMKEILAIEYDHEAPLSSEEAAALRIDPNWGRWNPKRLKSNENIPLRIGFESYHNTMNKVIEDATQEWEKYMDLGFVFAEDDLDILVRNNAEGNSSRLGVASKLFASKGVPSLKLQDFSDSTHEVRFGVTLHELGHALGLVHEHQHPESGIRFNEPAVVEYFFKTYGWKEEITKRNVLDRYSTTGKYSVGARTEFDPKSIMLYELPAELLENSSDVLAMNLRLSELDKQLIDNIY